MNSPYIYQYNKLFNSISDAFFMDRLIWQPELPLRQAGDFKIFLDRVFAQEMLCAQLPTMSREAMNKMGNEELKRLREVGTNPFMFYGDTCFVNQISLNVGKGLTLYTEGHDVLRQTNEPVIYETHNVERDYQIQGIVHLFNFWIQHTPDILNGFKP